MTVVYLDRVVLLNLAVDYLLLLATARLAGLPLRRGRLALAAALGALYAAAVFLPGCRMLAHPACRLAAGVAVCRLAWRRERRPWRLTALFFLLSGALAGLLLAAGLPLILPQMNARSLYLAGMLAFACAGSARRLAIAGVLELISLCSYMEAIFNCTIIPMNVLSLMAIACATVILLELLDKLGIKGALSRESNA